MTSRTCKAFAWAAFALLCMSSVAGTADTAPKRKIGWGSQSPARTRALVNLRTVRGGVPLELLQSPAYQPIN